MLADNALETSWTEEMVENYLKENDCSKELEAVKKSYKHEDPLKQKYIALAMHIQDGFYKGYPGLKARMKRELEYAQTHGYCRNVFGGVRNMIELMLKGSYDEQALSKTLKNLSNISSNYRAQSHEISIRGRAQYELQEWLIKNNYKSYTWNEIHDSADFNIYKTELHDVLAHAKHLFERRIPELRDTWVPLRMDCEVSDLTKGDYYKGGQSPEVYGVTWKNLEYEDPDPFSVELADDFEKDYFKTRSEYWKDLNREDPIKDKINDYLKNKAS